MQTLKLQNSILYVGETFQNLEKYLPDIHAIIVTDENVFLHYQDFLSNFECIVIPAGEKNKTWQTVEFIVEKLLEKKADRSTFLVGFGGGFVTDITGFVASIFMRGIRFGFVATTLLSQVDASLGGKNGVNFQHYKNMLGVFNSPEFVICDTELLKTLPEKEVRSGFGEILKHALIKDVGLFDFLQENATKLLALDKDLTEKMIWEAVQIKAKIVEADWNEQGERKILNFGHTLGHAIENNSELTHGEAVAVGMFWASKWSVRKGFLNSEELPKIQHFLQDFHLPTECNVSADVLSKFVQKDKKKQGEAIDFVFLEKIGKAKVGRVKIADLLAELH